MARPYTGGRPSTANLGDEIGRGRDVKSPLDPKPGSNFEFANGLVLVKVWIRIEKSRPNGNPSQHVETGIIAGYESVPQ